MRMNQLVALVAGAVLSSSFAFAANTKGAQAVEKAKTTMMTTCKKEFSKEVKGKTSFQEVAEWVESEETGTNAETFKTSKCFAAHEEWEKLTDKREAGEPSETH
jgi:hypothetical protein